MPHYKKAFDIGTYTGNGGQYRVGIPTLRGVGPTGTQIANSLRFRAAADTYLTRTPGSATGTSKATISFWVKFGTVGASSANYLFDSFFDGNNRFYIARLNDHTMQIAQIVSGSATLNYVTKMAFKDSNQWYHFLAQVDPTASGTSKCIFYVNGQQVTSYGTQIYSSFSSMSWNQANVHSIGRYSGGATYGHDGYLAEVYNLGDQLVAPTSFGEYNSDGIWVPKAYTGSYNTANDFYLKFASGAVGTDSSGKNNTWTLAVFNVTTSNTTYDLMTDSPADYLSGSMSTANNAGNYCTLNPLLKGSSITLSDGNLKGVMTNTSDNSFSGTTKITSGKWYWEVRITSPSTDYPYIGVASPVFDYTALGASCIRSSSTGFFKASNANKWNTSSSAYGSSFAAGDTMQIAFDADNGKIYFGKNGTWEASSDPATSANPAFTGISTPVVPAGFVSNCTWETNFGQRPFSYTPPAGYTALNTYNIPRPADSSLWFYGDTPDLLWIKNRSYATNHSLTDSVRGPGLDLLSSATDAELGNSVLTEFNKFGMSLLSPPSAERTNRSGNSFVYWAWKAGSNTSSTSVTNTDGTITSQVSANRQAGFSVVTYTGDGNLGGTVGHGLGVAPSLIIVKERTAAGNWPVYHVSLGKDIVMILNLTSATTSSSNYWGTGGVTSTVFGTSTSVGASNGTNRPIVAYCWAAIPGYSAFGSYAGNGVSDGPFVYTGFRPRWVMVKSITAASASNWNIYDTERPTYNPSRQPLYANATTAEPSLGLIFDTLSNGFKWREGGGQGNDSGVSYIYAAFAEIPFKFSRAR